MEERRLILAEYFKLYVILNKANRHSDEKTSLEFEFRENENNQIILFAFLAGGSQEAKIRLCLWSGKEGWQSAGFSGLNRFEEYCVEIFIKAEEKLKIKKRKPSENELVHMKKCLLNSFRELRFDHNT